MLLNNIKKHYGVDIMDNMSQSVTNKNIRIRGGKFKHKLGDHQMHYSLVGLYENEINVILLRLWYSIGQSIACDNKITWRHLIIAYKL